MKIFYSAVKDVNKFQYFQYFLYQMIGLKISFCNNLNGAQFYKVITTITTRMSNTNKLAWSFYTPTMAFTTRVFDLLVIVK